MQNSRIVQISHRGTVTIPADLRRDLALAADDVLSVRLEDGEIVLSPVQISPIEIYSDERIREFDREGALGADDLARAKRAWGLDDRGG